MQKYFHAFILMVMIAGCKGRHQEDTSLTSPGGLTYQLVQNWPSLPAGLKLGNPTGIGIDTAQNLVVFHRASREWPLFGSMPASLIKEKTILVLQRKTGQLLNSWGDNWFVMPHGLTVDDQNNIWVTDVGSHQVFKFSYEGKLLMKLGEANKPGNDPLHFNKPTDVAVAPDGSFYVSDGYGNSRVIKFNAAGQYLFEWGEKGDGPGQFDIPHSIALKEDRVLVADRENSRIQVFDSTGKFIAVYDNSKAGKVYAVAYDTAGKQLVATDYITNYIAPKGSDILLFDATGKSLHHWGRSGGYQGPVTRLHDIAVDKEGNIFVCDILKNRIQQFSKQ
jgi:peptidylamidoglycolate lyase